MTRARLFGLALLCLSLAFAGEDKKPEPKEVKVWITLQKGIRYHKETCQTIKLREKRELNIDEAKKRKYTPCKVCKPPR